MEKKPVTRRSLSLSRLSNNKDTSNFEWSLDLKSEASFVDEDTNVEDGIQNDSQENKIDEALREVRELARAETQGVRFWKIVVLLLMCVTAGLVSAGTYIFLKREEDDDYTQGYDLFAKSMQTAIEKHGNSIFLAMKSCSNIVSSDAIARGSEFPFHTVQNFEVIGEAIRRQSGLELFAFSPFVSTDEQMQWMQYSNANQGWVETSRKSAIDSGEVNVAVDYLDGKISPVIYDFGGVNDSARMVPPDPSGEPWSPVWQISPPPFDPRTVNFNFRFYSFLSEGIDIMKRTRRGHFTRILATGEIGRLARTGVSSADHDAYHKQFVDWDESKGDAFLNPHGAYIEPVFNETYNSESEIVGYLVAFVPWDAYIANLLPDGVEGVIVVVENSCGQAISYEVRGKRAVFLDREDLHDTSYDDTELIVSFDVAGLLQEDAVANECVHTFHIYSSSKFEESYRSNLPEVLAAVVACSFLFLIISFFIYDWFQNLRNRKVLGVAARSTDIVSSLFPSAVRDRIIAEREENEGHANGKNVFSSGSSDRRLQSFLSEAEDDEDRDVHNMYKSKPIADLYPDATVLFADIVGFTAWSSTREPAQVFTLLETLYGAFDQIAKRRRVFKVETIGDCYVAVAGVPDPMEDHAIHMCRFAYECLKKFMSLTRKLESVLGPDTADLSMRVGLHSGSVTAGVLRGERSRFQLFGDTMNTAARMESTGERGKLHVSQATADLLSAGGKGHWLKQREDKVFAKGKGELTTYWVKPSSRRANGAGSDTNSDLDSEHNRTAMHNSAFWEIDSEHNDLDQSESTGMHMERPDVNSSTTRLVEWNVDNLFKILTEIELWRNTQPATLGTTEDEYQDEYGAFSFNENVEEVQSELEAFVFNLAALYSEHPFHCFSHASNVSMSVSKLLAGLSPNGDGMRSSASLPSFDPEANQNAAETPAQALHGNPVSRFACMLAGIVHCLEHQGVPNSVLAADDTAMSNLYKAGSPSERLSFDTSWKLLQDDRFTNLRKSIYKNPSEQALFKEELLLCVLATDAMDKDTNADREKRWEFEFVGNPSIEEAVQDSNQRKTRLLMEHIMQASSMAHYMQHWEVFRKWDAKEFEEFYMAYSDNRSPQSPLDLWRDRELGIFDNRVIPIARRLCQSSAFHKATIDSYLSYAELNRCEWETNGEKIVAEMAVSLASSMVRKQSGTSLSTQQG